MVVSHLASGILVNYDTTADFLAIMAQKFSAKTFVSRSWHLRWHPAFPHKVKTGLFASVNQSEHYQFPRWWGGGRERGRLTKHISRENKSLIKTNNLVHFCGNARAPRQGYDVGKQIIDFFI